MYPFNLLKEEIYPLFGPDVGELPVYIDLSVDNENVEKISDQSQQVFNTFMLEEMRKNNKHPAVSSYLEDRPSM